MKRTVDPIRASLADNLTSEIIHRVDLECLLRDIEGEIIDMAVRGGSQMIDAFALSAWIRERKSLAGMA